MARKESVARPGITPSPHGSIAGAAPIVRPLEVARARIGDGSWEVTYSDGSVRMHVDLTNWLFEDLFKKKGKHAGH